jgi:hypothetical protein
LHLIVAWDADLGVRRAVQLDRSPPYATNSGSATAVLGNINVKNSVGMIVAPTPIRLLVLFPHFGKVFVLAMVLLRPHPIRLVFVVIPVVIVIMGSIVVDTIIVMVVAMVVMVLSKHRGWRDCNWRDESDSGKDCTA